MKNCFQVLLSICTFADTCWYLASALGVRGVPGAEVDAMLDREADVLALAAELTAHKREASATEAVDAKLAELKVAWTDIQNLTINPTP